MVMLRAIIVFLMLLHVHASKDNVICPDGKSMCFDTETCCVMMSGSYGCCPLPSAVCCSDKVHCCPSGYTCNLQTVSCDKGGRKIPMVTKKVARLVEGPITNKAPVVGNIVCPGGTSYCNNGNTCCKAKDGGYACCPLPQATCCSDHVHCCPSDYTCDLSAGGCTQGNDFIEMTKKTAAKQIIKAGDDSCSDRKHHCPRGSTCCPTLQGQYGCCPMGDAVCCKDKEHCCPNGFQCDDSESRCIANGTSVPYLIKIIPENERRKAAHKFQLIVHGNKFNNVFCPDHVSHCPSGFTCCKSAMGLWECCPLPDAICCSDHKHCCPHGTVCDLKEKLCTQKENGVSIPWVTKIKATSNQKNSVTCPDKRTSCPNGYTCCLLSSGMYGCCPYPSAVCCSDHAHCCPSGTSCDLAHGACISQDSYPLRKLDHTKSIVDTLHNDVIVCPDGKSFCHASNTCCQLGTGNYACCPYKKAVCCEDKEHCCPNGMMCDIKQGKCIKGNQIFPMKKKIPASFKQLQVICPDKSSCPSGYTCCKLGTGGYGCCPYKEAVCCSDGKHCCPHGTTCDLSSGTCVRGASSNAFTALTEVKRELVTCPDGTSCEGKETCCKLATGGYGCCPYKEAVCCSDGKHCCPHGTTCNLSSGTCVRGASSNAFTALAEVKHELVTCPDGTSCEGKETCCKLATGGYGCCPYREAVCCSDGKHCCPHGTTCNLSSGTCVRGASSNAFTALAEVKRELVTCPDGTSCEGKETCCKLATGGYGCCPYKEAVCCSDGKHCCPHGTTCNLSSGTCVRGASSNAFTALAEVKHELVTCPDGTSCEGKETCCKLATGGYGCCPYKEAVCCSDRKHCCPHGTTCNLSSSTCVRGASSNAFTALAEVKRELVTCPDGTSCEGKETCCKLATGGYGCCPYKEAVCCSDGKHCCPHGTTCNLSSGICNRKISLMSLIVKTSKSVPSKAIVCRDEISTCPDGFTCCPLQGGGYGCCHYENAVCCSDKEHCCPHGTKCDVQHARCVSREDFYPMKKKTPAMHLNSTMSVQCSKYSSCPDGYTCCKTADGGYGCCPYPKAVCCSDKVHCCPHGAICDLSQERCKPRSVIGVDGYQIMEKIMGNNRICPDGISSCPSHSTCCKLASGDYGCCPMKNAVCCSDGKHCCPYGTTCDVSAQTCISRNYKVKMLKKRKALRPADGKLDQVHKSNFAKTEEKAEVSIPESVICPNGKVSCRDGSTCCLKDQSTYGCCPKKNAVCCSDKKHCCPAGYRCGSYGYCLKGFLRIKALLPIENAIETKGNFKVNEGLALDEIMCPDKQTVCLEGTSCCMNKDESSFSCCPIPKAVCCSDHIHCCPNGWHCDIQQGTCRRGDETSVPSPLLKKIPGRKIKKIPSRDTNYNYIKFN